MSCTSSSKSKGLSSKTKKDLINGITSHTKQQNDKAEKQMLSYMNDAKQKVDNYESYKRLGIVKSKNDAWYQQQVDTYSNMKARYDFFRQKRAELRK